MRDLIYLVVLLFVGRHRSSGHLLQGGSCHDCQEHFEHWDSIPILVLYKLLWRSVLHLSCSFTRVVVAAIMITEAGSTKPK